MESTNETNEKMSEEKWNIWNMMYGFHKVIKLVKSLYEIEKHWAKKEPLLYK